MGRDAVANGLADRIGGIPEAIVAAAKLAGLENYSVVTYPEPVDRFQYMLRRFRNSPLTQLQQSLQAGEARQLAAFTSKMQQLYNRNRKIQMALPFDWSVN
jgi:protease-4